MILRVPWRAWRNGGERSPVRSVSHASHAQWAKLDGALSEDDARRAFRKAIESMGRVNRNGAKLMLIIAPSATAARARFACADPRVGCVLYKMYISPTQRDDTSHKHGVISEMAQRVTCSSPSPLGKLHTLHAAYLSSIDPATSRTRLADSPFFADVDPVAIDLLDVVVDVVVVLLR